MKSISYLLMIVLVTCGLVGPSIAQDESEAAAPAFPEADIFLFDCQLTKNAFTIQGGKNVTDRPGYENQPFFTADSSSFFFSRSSQAQTDVFEYIIESGESKQVTRSPNMEFSPTPSQDKQRVAYVTDGVGANQSIWQVDRNKLDQPAWLLKSQPEREPVGYFSWNQETGYILYWSRYGFNVRLVHESKKMSHYVSGDAVPTSPHIIPGTHLFSFLHRQGNGEVWIKELNPETLAIRPIVAINGSNAHYGWCPDKSLVRVEGTILFHWSPTSKSGWKKVADLADHGVAAASRIAVSPDGTKLAVVGTPVAMYNQ